MATTPKILCGHCGNEIRWGDPLCGACGVAVEWPGSVPAPAGGSVCPRCGSPVPSGSASCRACGADLRGGTGTQKQGTQNRVREGKASPGFLDRLREKPAYAIAGLAAVALIVFAVALTVDQRSVRTAETPAQPSAGPFTPQPEAPNMAAMPQIESLKAQVAANPSDLTATLQLANLLHDNRFFDQAVEYYRTYLQKRPKDANARVDLGICLHELGKDNEAKKEMTQALADDPKHVNATFNLGIIDLTQGNLKEANEWFTKTVSLSPNSEVGQRAQQLLKQHNPQLIQQSQ